MLKSVPDWQTLGTKLGLPDYRIEEIRIDNNVFGVVCQRQTMINKWLQYDLVASWSKLADALEEMGINKVAKDIRDTYIHSYRSKFTKSVHITLSSDAYMHACHLHSFPHTAQGLKWLGVSVLVYYSNWVYIPAKTFHGLVFHSLCASINNFNTVLYIAMSLKYLMLY